MQNNANNLPARRRRPLWPFIIVGLLIAHVAGMAIAVTIAQRDPTFLVVPDYYEKGRHWDESRAEKAKGEKLGRQVKPGEFADRVSGEKVKP